MGAINLAKYGEGEIYIGLSKSKLSAAGKKPDASALQDPAVAKDLVRILVGGYVGEQIAAGFDPDLVPNLSCAAPDHALAREQLANVRLPEDFAEFETEAKNILVAHWPKIETVANYLMQKINAAPDEVVALLA